MTKREAAIITAYTGILIGKFNEFHKYIEEKAGRGVYTHEFTSIDCKELSKQDFLNITITEEQ